MAVGICTFCESIPDFLAVEIMQTSERLPEAVEKLILVTRHVRKCPDCGSFFEFNYDHDGEFSDGEGTPIGYTDESIERIKPEHIQALLKDHILHQDLVIHNFAERDDAWAKHVVEEATKNKAALEAELQANR